MATNYAHFIKFPVASTNIFPLVNSKQGGQLATEFNLKSREMVATNPEIKYAQGPSFIHSLDDFKVTASSSSTAILEIAPGRAVINGHYFESLTTVTIDMIEANTVLQQNAQSPLFGNLSIGFRSYFSTVSTMAGSMSVENSEDMYIGIQLVIAKTTDFITPTDSPTDRDAVVADLKLADFTYINGSISAASIAQNENATRYIPSERIADFNSILDSKYVTTENVADNFFYTLSGTSKSWCDSTGSLMIWDNDSGAHTTTEEPTLPEATFLTNPKGSISLVVPHKQQDGLMNDQGQPKYYADKWIDIPAANYNNGTPGVVTSDYTDHILKLENALNSYKQFTNGKQIKYIDVLTEDNKQDMFLSENPSKFNVGDYILVHEDYTVYPNAVTEGTAPSTMYIVLPGGVTSIEWQDTTQPNGIRLGAIWTWWSGTDPQPTSTEPSAEELLEGFNYTEFNGTLDDYFELVYRNDTDDEGTSYYYKVTSTGPKQWSSAVLLTGGTSLATDSQIGGFYNAPTSATDAGYVYLDNTGHLRLIDYELLRSGTLAYQLGSDVIVPANTTVAYIQEYLDDNVNERIAFPFTSTLSSTPAMINVTFTLPKDAEGVINLHDIDSRFGAGVYLHLLFDTSDTSVNYSNIIINISNCEKVRIDSNIATLGINGPMINVFRSCLYYDASIINYIRTCDPNNYREIAFSNFTDFTGFDNLTLWYAQFSSSDPDLVVNGMEVSQPNVAMVTEEISFWSENIQNDNHYQYALRSITLSQSGKIIACSLYIASPSTQTVNTTQHVIIGGKFQLPQGSALNYPVACINDPLQITGVFTVAYLDSSHTKWITTETSFAARTGTYDPALGVTDGSIVFNSKTDLIDNIYTSVTSMDCCEPGAFHIFYGGTTV